MRFYEGKTQMEAAKELAIFSGTDIAYRKGCAEKYAQLSHAVKCQGYRSGSKKAALDRYSQL